MGLMAVGMVGVGGSGGLGVLLQPEWFCDSMGGHSGGGLTDLVMVEVWWYCDSMILIA